MFYLIIDNGEKQRPKIYKLIIIHYINNKYYLHYWIIFLIIFLILIPIIVVYKYTNLLALIMSICLGSILQCLTYNDAFEIKIK